MLYQKCWHVLFQSLNKENVQPTGIIWALPSCLHPWEMQAPHSSHEGHEMLSPLWHKEVSRITQAMTFLAPPAKPRGDRLGNTFEDVSHQVKAKASSMHRVPRCDPDPRLDSVKDYLIWALQNLIHSEIGDFWDPGILSLFISWIHTPWFLPRRDFRAPERIIKG